MTRRTIHLTALIGAVTALTAVGGHHVNAGESGAVNATAPTTTVAAPATTMMSATTTPPTTAPVSPTTASPSSGYQVLTDDTGAIAVATPATWTDIATTPYASDAGNSYPQITADDPVSGSSALVRATSNELAVDDVFAEVIGEFITDCGGDPVEQPFESATFTGRSAHWAECASGVGEVTVVIADSRDLSHLLIAVVEVAPADPYTAATILGSIGFAGQVTAPTPVSPPAQPAGPATTPPTTVATAPTPPPTTVAPAPTSTSGLQGR